MNGRSPDLAARVRGSITVAGPVPDSHRIPYSPPAHSHHCEVTLRGTNHRYTIINAVSIAPKISVRRRCSLRSKVIVVRTVNESITYGKSAAAWLGERVRRVPIAMSGLGLALGSLGNLLAAYSPVARSVCGLLSATVIGLVIARIALDWDGVKRETANPAVLAVAPTFTMALMVLSTYMAEFGSTAAYAIAFAIWASAVLLQFGIVGLFMWRHLRGFRLQRVLPSWFVTFVGYVVAAVTSPVFGAEPFGLAIVVIGMGAYGLMLPLIYYRLLNIGRPDEPVSPTLTILVAPGSLALAGYLAVAAQPETSIVYVLLAITAASMVIVLSQMSRLLWLRFYPSCSAMSFPFVITAIAVRGAERALSVAPDATGSAVSSVLATVAPATELLAVGMVAYVMVRYASYLFLRRS